MKKEIEVGDLVVFNTLADATVFKVLEHPAKFTLVVREAGRPKDAKRMVDISLYRQATPEQCMNHLKDLS